MSDAKIDSNLVLLAADLARKAHAGQFRRDGVTPYIGHPAAVASRVGGDPKAQAVAWLHDVLEDTEMTSDSMRKAGIPEEIVGCVEMLTKKSGVDYEQYLAQIKAYPLAKKVKIADMLSNLSDHPTEGQMVKYAKGLLVLLT